MQRKTQQTITYMWTHPHWHWHITYVFGTKGNLSSMANLSIISISIFFFMLKFSFPFMSEYKKLTPVWVLMIFSIFLFFRCDNWGQYCQYRSKSSYYCFYCRRVEDKKKRCHFAAASFCSDFTLQWLCNF